MNQKIEIYDRGRLLCICGSRDWRIFLPNLRDGQFIHVMSVFAKTARFTWVWVMPTPEER